MAELSLLVFDRAEIRLNGVVAANTMFEVFHFAFHFLFPFRKKLQFFFYLLEPVLYD